MKLKNFTFHPIIFLIILSFFLNSCGIYRKTDSRVIPVNEKDKRQKNMQEGRKIKFGKGSNKSGGNFEFASSNPMWKAAMNVLSFMPLANADYSGGLIITDWYDQKEEDNESIKITVRFLTNEIRADGLKVIIHKKVCDLKMKCKTQIVNNSLNSEVKLAILKQAAAYEVDKLKDIKQESGEIILRR